MKKLILVSVLLAAVGSKAQEVPLTDHKVSAVYGALWHKDIASVMKGLNMTDTIGKTYPATFEQYKPEQKGLVLKRENGEQLAFFNNRLEVVIPKHKPLF